MPGTILLRRLWRLDFCEMSPQKDLYFDKLNMQRTRGGQQIPAAVSSQHGKTFLDLKFNDILQVLKVQIRI